MTSRLYSRDDLLTPVKARWTFAKKLALVTGVRLGIVTVKEVCEAHGISPEEFLDWYLGYEKRGVDALRTASNRGWRRTG